MVEVLAKHSPGNNFTIGSGCHAKRSPTLLSGWSATCLGGTQYTRTQPIEMKSIAPRPKETLWQEERDRDSSPHHCAMTSKAPATAQQQDWTQAQPLLPRILNSCHQVDRFSKGHSNLASHSSPSSLLGSQ